MKDKLIEHHIKYKEIHGADETVSMTNSEHRKLHIRLRKEGKCNVSVEDLNKISKKAHQRTNKGKIKKREWKKSDKGKSYHKNYKKINEKEIVFTASFGPYTMFHETIKCNHKTGSVTYIAGFYGTHGRKLAVINIL